MTIQVKDANGETQTINTIADLLALVALAAKQDTGNAALADILTKLADPATQTTLAAVLAKLSDDPATQTGLTALAGKLDQLHTDIATTLAAYVDGLEGLVGTTNTGNAAILAKMIAGPSTETTLAGVKTSVDALAALITAGKLLVTASIDADSVNANLTPTGTSQEGAPTVNIDNYGTHKEVAASQTAKVLGATGAAGDYLAYLVVFPGAVDCGVVTCLDGSTEIGTFAGGGTTPLPDLRPFTIPVGAYAATAWKITTGADVTVVAVGKFT